MYSQRRNKKKLYRQWVKIAGLSPEALPGGKVAENITPATDKAKQRLGVLYILLAASVIMFCTAVILLILNS